MSSAHLTEGPSQSYQATIAAWAAGWTVGALLLLIAYTAADLSVPHNAALAAFFVGIPTVAVPVYLSTKRFGGRRPEVEAAVWLTCFVAMWFAYAWVNVPTGLNINTTESMRERAEYFRHERWPIEVSRLLWAIAVFGVVAAFGSAICNRSPAGEENTLLQAIIFSVVVGVSLMVAIALFMTSASIFVLVAPAVAGAAAGVGITFGRRTVWPSGAEEIS